MTLPLDQLARIDAGGARLQSLADIKPSELQPTNIAADEYRIDQTLAGVPMTLVGFSPQRGIAQRPGTTLSWQIDGSAQSFIVTVGVPATLLPVGTVRFIVLADGREVARSNPMSSVDDPQSLAADVSNAKVLLLRVEASPAAPGLSPGLEGLWGNPLCVHR
jgi:hypothetical protein